jgi:hypothetical protein
MTIKFKAKLKAGIKYDDIAKVYVTYSPSLGIYSQGINKIQAKLALEDAVASFISVAHKNGVLDKILKSVELCNEEEITVQEEKILENKLFQDIFEFPASIYCAAMG